MLYEVITAHQAGLVTGLFDRAEQYRRLQARQPLHIGFFGGQIDARCQHAGHRITSYNVCYTKLLRLYQGNEYRNNLLAKSGSLLTPDELKSLSDLLDSRRELLEQLNKRHLPGAIPPGWHLRNNFV